MNRIIVFFLLLSTSCIQDKKVEKSDSDSVTIVDTSIKKYENKALDSITFIKEKVKHINTTVLEKKHFEFLCDEKTKVDFFYENHEIVKISIDFGTVGDVYAKEDYYYSRGKLIFFYEFVEGGPACEGCIKTNEFRSYIKNDKVFKYLKDKEIEKCRKCEFSVNSRQYRLLNATTLADVKAVVCR
ncbi:hypothetical protein WG904_10935 [Pedobacter sp. Du54]|uniref:hypothetical protein n=1 Tax=Pedobacter anseongensis TaxID=3133439 RepID=UPI00309A403E